MTADDSAQQDVEAPLTDHREQLELLSRTLEREAHILAREPEVLSSHLHNMLLLDEGEEGPAGPLLARACEALAGRPWLRLTNRPPVERSALIRVMEHGAAIRVLAWSPDGALLASGSVDNTVRLWDPATGDCRVVTHCLAPLGELQFSDDGRILRVADDGAATGNRPIPYLFELCNIEIGPPVAPPAPPPPEPVAEPAARRTKRAPSPKKPAAKRPARKTAAPPDCPSARTAAPATALVSVLAARVMAAGLRRPHADQSVCCRATSSLLVGVQEPRLTTKSRKSCALTWSCS